MQGILADNDVRGQVDYLIALMQAEPWQEFWWDLGLTVYRFPDLGLDVAATDLEVWYARTTPQIVCRC